MLSIFGPRGLRVGGDQDHAEPQARDDVADGQLQRVDVMAWLRRGVKSSWVVRRSESHSHAGQTNARLPALLSPVCPPELLPLCSR